MNTGRFPLKIRLYKSGEMVYFSQLDIARLMGRALRRTGLPVYYTGGFNPRVKMSFSNALKLGIEGEMEITLYFTAEVRRFSLTGALQKELPEGLKIIPDV